MTFLDSSSRQQALLINIIGIRKIEKIKCAYLTERVGLELSSDLGKKDKIPNVINFSAELGSIYKPNSYYIRLTKHQQK